MKKKHLPKQRSFETLFALLKCKGGKMRDRRLRRPNDARRKQQQEE